MKFTSENDLTNIESKALLHALEAASHSVCKGGHKVGAAVMCKNGDVFVGAANSRSRAIGSTCAERMALDQLYFFGNRQPILCSVIGIFSRAGWQEDYICTPCGACLEMFFECLKDFRLKGLDFKCSN